MMLLDLVEEGVQGLDGTKAEESQNFILYRYMYVRAYMCISKDNCLLLSGFMLTCLLSKSHKAVHEVEREPELIEYRSSLLYFFHEVTVNLLDLTHIQFHNTL